MDFRELVDGEDRLLDQTLTGRLAPGQSLNRITFERCAFVGCVWDEARVRSCDFIECTFANCSMSMTDFTDSRFAECSWQDCRILSVDWAAVHCNPVAAEPMVFTGCRLTYSRFARADLRRWRFERCDLVDADFSDARLSDAAIKECNLQSTQFVNVDMRGLDLSGSFDYYFDVRDNQVAGLRVGAADGVNLLRVFGVELID